jgi:hypothetical protein
MVGLERTRGSVTLLELDCGMGDAEAVRKFVSKAREAVTSTDA